MKKNLSLLLFYPVLSIGLAFGQGYTFKVLVNSGQNQVKKESGETVALKTGTELFDLEEVISSDGSYIGLMHKSGKTAEIRGAGTWKVSDLAAEVNVKSTSSISRYAQFIAAKMSEDDNAGNRQRTNTIGAVSRSFSEFVVLLPDVSLEVLSDEAIIRWMPPKPADDETADDSTGFTVTIADLYGEVIHTEKITDSFYSLKFDEIDNESNFYIFQVKQTGNEGVASEEYGIRKIGAKDKPEIADNLNTLLADLPEGSPLNNIVLAGFYEENGLLLDALTQYEQAMQGSPEVEDFKVFYEDFLVDYKIAPEEEE